MHVGWTLERIAVVDAGGENAGKFRDGYEENDAKRKLNIAGGALDGCCRSFDRVKVSRNVIKSRKDNPFERNMYSCRLSCS